MAPIEGMRVLRVDHTLGDETVTAHGESHLGALVVVDAHAGETPLPLQKVVVRASVTGAACETHVTQVFRNDAASHMSATHLFPLPLDAAVTHMVLKAGDLVVQAETRPKQAAQEEFEQAERTGHRAALMSKEDGSDVHRLQVTNLPPNCDVEVQFTLVQMLKCVDGTLRWRFPTVVAPRYTPKHQSDHQPELPVASDVDGEKRGLPGLPICGTATDAPVAVEWPQPPLRLSGGTRLDLELIVQGAVKTLTCSQHAVSMELGENIVKVRPAGIATLNKDFVVSFSTAASKAIATSAFTNSEYSAVVVQAPASMVEASKLRLRRQAVFIIDISGSMGGSKIETSKRALVSALHALVPGDEFKLIAFDNRLELFERGHLVEYTDANVKRADAWISKLEARGGTEMLPALKEGFNTFSSGGAISRAGSIVSGVVASVMPGGSKPEKSNLPAFRSLLFITDGQSWDEARLVQEVAALRDASRDANGTPPTLFTLGIDTAVNESLLSRLARIGGGVCELATPSDDIEAIIMRMETDFGGSVLQKVEVVGSGLSLPYAALPGTSPGLFVSMNAMELYTGRPLVFLLRGGAGLSQVTVRGIDKNGQLVELMTPVVTVQQSGAASTEALFEHASANYGALFAKQRILYLEDVMMVQPDLSQAAKAEIERLGLEFKLVTSETSKVAVEKSTSVRDQSAPLVHVMQPVELPESWDQGFVAGGVYGAGPARRNRSGLQTDAFICLSGASVPPAMCMAAPPPQCAPAGGMATGEQCKRADVGMPPAKSKKKGGFIGGSGFMSSMGGAVFGARAGRMSAPRYEAARAAAPEGVCYEAPAEDDCEFEAGNALLEQEEAAVKESCFTDSSEASVEAAPKARKRQEKSAPKKTMADAAGELARLQSANGSFDNNSVEATCFAVLALLLLGHTTATGIRQRTVLKAVTWLSSQPSNALIQQTLQALERVEDGEPSVSVCMPVARSALAASAHKSAAVEEVLACVVAQCA
ncbi:von Willebrand factor A domain-containing protein 5A [Porphyridium purpureum]|uniref:von Willebrand factor A domain-containing protein 5A n=1 Tax=Porphyridium purpureum TaxID=35688 RepID=A0A5J4YR88_PORPP|nr:von Willebrand factor A domain-containing protein 5A [Porphyridium purpureum]|eukprot:POR0627..scf222_8